MKIVNSPLVTVTFQARELVVATSVFISDVAPDCLLVGDACMVESAQSFLRAVIEADFAVLREAFAGGIAMPSFCGVSSEELDRLEAPGFLVRVVIQWPEVRGCGPVGQPRPVIREARELVLTGDSEVTW